MQDRYITRPFAHYAGDEFSAEPLKTTVVIENDDAVNTGLLDADGRKLFRVRERGPFGFTGR